MLSLQPHRKRIRHFHEPGEIHELSFSCYRRLPLLTNNSRRTILSRSIDESCQSHGCHFRTQMNVFGGPKGTLAVAYRPENGLAPRMGKWSLIHIKRRQSVSRPLAVQGGKYCRAHSSKSLLAY